MPLAGDADPGLSGAPRKNAARGAKHNKAESQDNDNVNEPHEPHDMVPTVNPFLNELAAQLGQLTLTMQELSHDNQLMRADLAQCKSASRLFPVDGAPSWLQQRPVDGQYSSRPAQRDEQPVANHDAYFPGHSRGYQTPGPDTPVSLMNGARITRKLVASAKAGE